jgi:hypothetical protein
MVAGATLHFIIVAISDGRGAFDSLSEDEEPVVCHQSGPYPYGRGAESEAW